MLEKLASSMGRNDEELNILLAQELCEQMNEDGIKEMISGLKGKNKAIANDCIKVLYEIGSINPQLIADYEADFLALLLSKNNRLVWGSMMALAAIADLKSDEIFVQIATVKTAYETGSVITIDNSMTVFAKLCKANKKYEKELFPLLINHIRTCRPKEVPQHAERIFLCINSQNAKEFKTALDSRKEELSASQAKRIDKLMKQLSI